MITGLGFAQSTPAMDTERFYQALNSGDSLDISMFLSKELVVEHMELDTSFSFDYNQFMTICDKFKSGKFREEIKIVQESISNSLVSIVEVDFSFYLNDTLDHCGTDVFVWKVSKEAGVTSSRIFNIYSTPVDCDKKKEEEASHNRFYTEELDRLMNDWHEAASDSDFEAYFNFMANGFYYLGTADGERWSKEEFASFSKPYFDDNKGWSFTADKRNWDFNEDFSIAWFDEDLSTWMEGCRGTGVLIRDHNYEWKIYHYNLTVLIENEKIKDFIKLRKSKIKNKKSDDEDEEDDY
jgi:hypothetical protein